MIHEPMSHEELAELERVYVSATAGEWWDDSYNTVFAGSGEESKIMFSIPDHPQGDLYEPEQSRERSDWYKESERNKSAILAIHNAFPRLLATIRAVRGRDAAPNDGILSSDVAHEYKQRIQELAVLPVNWDSYGAHAPSIPALLAAEKVLHSKATVVPRSNGGVQIDWPCGSEISFNPDGSQEFQKQSIRVGFLPAPGSKCSGTT